MKAIAIVAISPLTTRGPVLTRYLSLVVWAERFFGRLNRRDHSVIVVPTTEGLAILTTLTATGGDLNGAKVHLYANPLVPTPTTDLADFTTATFTGYATSGAIVWGTPFVNGDGLPTVAGGLVTFASTSPFTVGNTIYGYYVTNGAGSVLLFSEQFDTPIVISAALQAVMVLPTFSVGSQP
jgi:hypothetical protein